MNKLYAFEGSSQLWGQQALNVERTRVIGTFGNANLFGGSLVMLSAIVISFAVNSKGLKRFVSIAVFLALAAAILMTTGSRTSVIGLFVVSSFSLILSLRKGMRFKALIYLVLFSIMVIFVQNNIEYLPINPRLKEIILGKGGIATVGSFYVRLGMWQESINKAKESIVFGVGASKTLVQETDNGYIYTLLRTGIIGLTIYVSMLISLLVLGIRSFALTSCPLKRAAILASTMVVVNSAVFEVTGEFFWNVRYGTTFAVFTGLLCGLANQVRYESQYGTYVDNDNYYPPDECGPC